MNRERIVRLMAGTFILVSLALGLLHSPYWFLFTGFVGRFLDFISGFRFFYNRLRVVGSLNFCGLFHCLICYFIGFVCPEHQVFGFDRAIYIVSLLNPGFGG